MRSKDKKPSQKKRKIMLLVICILGFILALSALYIFVLDKDTSNNGNPSKGSSTINYNPPTEEEKAETDAFKKESTQDRLSTNPPTKEETTTDTGANVKPIIADSGVYGNNVEIASFVPGIYESGGVCKTTLSKGSQSIERSSNAVQDATTTRCPTTTIKIQELSSGEWSVVVTYTSSSHQGTSDTKKLTIN